MPNKWPLRNLLVFYVTGPPEDAASLEPMNDRDDIFVIILCIDSLLSLVRGTNILDWVLDMMLVFEGCVLLGKQELG